MSIDNISISEQRDKNAAAGRMCPVCGGRLIPQHDSIMDGLDFVDVILECYECNHLIKATLELKSIEVLNQGKV